jgi:hypothetical protein
LEKLMAQRTPVVVEPELLIVVALEERPLVDEVDVAPARNIMSPSLLSSHE